MIFDLRKGLLNNKVAPYPKNFQPHSNLIPISVSYYREYEPSHRFRQTMIESLFILFIIFLFILPTPTLALAFGLSTSHLLYKQYLLLRNQPVKFKRVAWLTLICSGVNLTLSLVLALAMSYAVFYFLAQQTWLFIFNFLFCFLVSARWFDFSNSLFRSYIHRLSEKHTSAPKTTGESTFVMIFGLRKSIGWGAGLMPVFVDAGDINLDDENPHFKGLFLDFKLGQGEIESAAPSSSEQIIFAPRHNPPSLRVDRFRLVVRDQFYPFRCREKRDQLLDRMNSLKNPASKIISSQALEIQELLR